MDKIIKTAKAVLKGLFLALIVFTVFGNWVSPEDPFTGQDFWNDTDAQILSALVSLIILILFIKHELERFFGRV